MSQPNNTEQRKGMGWEGSAVATIEHLMHADLGDTERGQNLGRFYEGTKGNLFSAAQSIATSSEEKPVLRILTGFYIEKSGAAETDGILSAAQMVYFFKLAGIDCCITTDKHCEDMCQIALAEVGCADRLEVVPDDTLEATAQHIDHWKAAAVTHAIAVERPGPSLSDELAYNMRGEPLQHCAPLHLLFKGGSWKKIGVIDRGNEIGSGSLSAEIISEDIKNGSRIACKVGADHLLVSRVSNWGANALTAAVAILGKNEWPSYLKQALDTNLQKKILVSMVRAGSVDGITLACNPNSPTVDALPLSAHNRMTQSFLATVMHATKGRNISQASLQTPIRVDRRKNSSHGRPNHGLAAA